MPRVTCTDCGKTIFTAASYSHRCAKPKMTAEEKAAFNPRFSEFFQPRFTAARSEALGEGDDERPEVFLDTFVGAAQTVWRSAKRQ